MIAILICKFRLLIIFFWKVDEIASRPSHGVGAGKHLLIIDSLSLSLSLSLYSCKYICVCVCDVLKKSISFEMYRSFLKKYVPFRNLITQPVLI